MPRSELQEFARTFGEYQLQVGYPAPLIMETLGEALRALSIGNQMQFEPVPHSVSMLA